MHLHEILKVEMKEELSWCFWLLLGNNLVERLVSCLQLPGAGGSCKGGRCRTPCSRPNHYLPLRVVKKHLWKQCSWLPRPGFLSTHLIFCDWDYSTLRRSYPWCSTSIACLLILHSPNGFVSNQLPVLNSFFLKLLKGIKIFYPKIFYVSMSIILNWRQLRNSRHRKTLYSLPLCLKAGYKFPSEKVSPPLSPIPGKRDNSLRLSNATPTWVYKNKLLK